MEDLMRMGDEISSDMSEITVESAEMVDVEGGVTSSNLNYVASELMPTEWTNEKHCLYLKTMEASFVNELHFSMGLLKDPAQKHASKKDPSDQYKTLRDGSCKSISLNKCRDKSKAATEAHALMASPWIRHFRRNGKHHEVEASISQDIDENVDQDTRSEKKATLGSDNNSRQLVATSLSRQDSVGSNTEMSDQNFVDNEEFMITSPTCSKRKRAKVVLNDLTTPQQSLKT
ncbi:hypothetical protein QQ045_028512 [Rhodiola kirilowii]